MVAFTCAIRFVNSLTAYQEDSYTSIHSWCMLCINIHISVCSCRWKSALRAGLLGTWWQYLHFVLAPVTPLAPWFPVQSPESYGHFWLPGEAGLGGEGKRKSQRKRSERTLNVIYSFQYYCHSCQIQFWFTYFIFLVIVDFLPQELSLTLSAQSQDKS